ncbi:MAG TPA: hypothetical protein EYP19_04250, partial [Desulfobacterales bacterium]|nr:hypothetical protein [Desulfobacterales bacterium]
MRLLMVTIFTFSLATVCTAVDVGELLKSLPHQLVSVRAEGYHPHLTEVLIRRAVQLMRNGKNDEAHELLLRAKGALVDIKLPEWARDLCYRHPRDIERMNLGRDVIFWRGWVFPVAWTGQWFRGYCRPTRTALETIEGFHRKRFRVGT